MSYYLLILAGALLTVALLALAAHEFAVLGRQRRRAVNGSLLNREERAYLGRDELQRRFARTRPGKWLARELDLAGLAMQPLTVAALAALVSLVAVVLVSQLLAPGLAFVGVVLGLFGLREFLRHAQQRRTEAFVGQLPEIARVLANASGAGLALPTAIAMAADELAEPASTELGRMATRLRFGAPLGTVLDELRDRVDSREVSVLMSTLVVSARSGGSLASALRNIAGTLEDRKETRREVQTTLAQSLSTGYMVIAMGFVILVLLNLLWPGTVDTMVHNIIGQVALAVSFLLFAGGFVLIRRMTRIQL